MFASVGELPCERLETGTHTEALNLFFQVCFSPLCLRTRLVQKKVQVFLELTKRGERVQGIAPRPALNSDSSRSPCTGWMAGMDGRVTEDSTQQSGCSHSSAAQQRKAGKGVQEGLPCTSPGFSGPCVSSSLRAEAPGPPGGPWGKDPNRAPRKATWSRPSKQRPGKGRNSSITHNGQHPVAKEAESRNLPRGFVAVWFPREDRAHISPVLWVFDYFLLFFSHVSFVFFLNLKQKQYVISLKDSSSINFR